MLPNGEIHYRVRDSPEGTKSGPKTYLRVCVCVRACVCVCMCLRGAFILTPLRGAGSLLAVGLIIYKISMLFTRGWFHVCSASFGTNLEFGSRSCSRVFNRLVGWLVGWSLAGLLSSLLAWWASRHIKIDKIRLTGAVGDRLPNSERVCGVDLQQNLVASLALNRSIVRRRMHSFFKSATLTLTTLSCGRTKKFYDRS